jgi:O-antigen/teichoic acid export membrane protein
LPLSVLFTGLYQSLNYWVNRKKNYPQLAASKVIQGAGAAGVNLGGGLLVSGPFGLIGGRLAGQILATLYLLGKNGRTLVTQRKYWQFAPLLGQAGKYKNFPLYTTWSILFNMGAMQLPLFFLAGVFGGTAAGFYTLASRVLTMPVSLAGAALGQVYYKSALDDRNQPGRLKEISLNLFLHLLLAGTLPTAVLLAFGDVLFRWLFGAEWLMAGSFTRALSPWLLLVFVSSPLTGLFNVFDRQEEMLYWDAAIFLLSLLALLTGTMVFRDALTTIVILAGVSFLFRLGLTAYLLKLVGVRYRQSLLTAVGLIAGPGALLWLIRIIVL